MIIRQTHGYLQRDLQLLAEVYFLVKKDKQIHNFLPILKKRIKENQFVLSNMKYFEQFYIEFVKQYGIFGDFDVSFEATKQKLNDLRLATIFSRLRQLKNAFKAIIQQYQLKYLNKSQSLIYLHGVHKADEFRSVYLQRKTFTELKTQLFNIMVAKQSQKSVIRDAKLENLRQKFICNQNLNLLQHVFSLFKGILPQLQRQSKILNIKQKVLDFVFVKTLKMQEIAFNEWRAKIRFGAVQQAQVHALQLRQARGMVATAYYILRLRFFQGRMYLNQMSRYEMEKYVQKLNKLNFSGITAGISNGFGNAKRIAAINRNRANQQGNLNSDFQNQSHREQGSNNERGQLMNIFYGNQFATQQLTLWQCFLLQRGFVAWKRKSVDIKLKINVIVQIKTQKLILKAWFLWRKESFKSQRIGIFIAYYDKKVLQAAFTELLCRYQRLTFAPRGQSAGKTALKEMNQKIQIDEQKCKTIIAVDNYRILIKAMREIRRLTSILRKRNNFLVVTDHRLISKAFYDWREKAKCSYLEQLKKQESQYKCGIYAKVLKTLCQNTLQNTGLDDLYINYPTIVQVLNQQQNFDLLASSVVFDERETFAKYFFLWRRFVTMRRKQKTDVVKTDYFHRFLLMKVVFNRMQLRVKLRFVECGFQNADSDYLKQKYFKLLRLLAIYRQLCVRRNFNLAGSVLRQIRAFARNNQIVQNVQLQQGVRLARKAFIALRERLKIAKFIELLPISDTDKRELKSIAKFGGPDFVDKIRAYLTVHKEIPVEVRELLQKLLKDGKTELFSASQIAALNEIVEKSQEFHYQHWMAVALKLFNYWRSRYHQLHLLERQCTNVQNFYLRFRVFFAMMTVNQQFFQDNVESVNFQHKNSVRTAFASWRNACRLKGLCREIQSGKKYRKMTLIFHHMLKKKEVIVYLNEVGERLMHISNKYLLIRALLAWSVMSKKTSIISRQQNQQTSKFAKNYFFLWHKATSNLNIARQFRYQCMLSCFKSWRCATNQQLKASDFNFYSLLRIAFNNMKKNVHQVLTEKEQLNFGDSFYNKQLIRKAFWCFLEQLKQEQKIKQFLQIRQLQQLNNSFHCLYSKFAQERSSQQKLKLQSNSALKFLTFKIWHLESKSSQVQKFRGKMLQFKTLKLLKYVAILAFLTRSSCAQYRLKNIKKEISSDVTSIQSKEGQTIITNISNNQYKAFFAWRLKHFHLLKQFLLISDQCEALLCKQALKSLKESIYIRLQLRADLMNIANNFYEHAVQRKTLDLIKRSYLLNKLIKKADMHLKFKLTRKYIGSLRQALLCRNDKGYLVKLKFKKGLKVWRVIAANNSIERAIEIKAERWHRKKTLRKLLDYWLIQYNVQCNVLIGLDD